MASVPSPSFLLDALSTYTGGGTDVTVTKMEAGAKPGASALTIAEPTLTPVICGCVAGVVAPPGMKTLEGDTVAFEVEVREIVTPPRGAGTDNAIGTVTGTPTLTLALDGQSMEPVLTTVTFSVADASCGIGALAAMIALPPAIPVTGTATLNAPAGNTTPGGTVATAELLEIRKTVSPPTGAGPERLRIAF